MEIALTLLKILSFAAGLYYTLHYITNVVRVIIGQNGRTNSRALVISWSLFYSLTILI